MGDCPLPHNNLDVLLRLNDGDPSSEVSARAIPDGGRIADTTIKKEKGRRERSEPQHTENGKKTSTQ